MDIKRILVPLLIINGILSLLCAAFNEPIAHPWFKHLYVAALELTIVYSLTRNGKV